MFKAKLAAALLLSSGREVEKVFTGAALKGKTYTNGLRVSGSCAMKSCLLTFK